MKVILLLFILIIDGQFIFAQNYSTKEKVLRLLNINRDEDLTTEELAERLRLGRILQHVYQSDTMVFNPENINEIKKLPQEYVEYTKSYFKLMNNLLKSLNAQQKELMRNFWADYDITTPIMIGFLKHDTRSYCLSISKSEVLKIGVTEKEYDKIVKMIKGVNTALAEVDTVYFGKSMYREDVSTIFFPNDVILGLDNGDGFIYRRFKESFLAMIQAFKKQFYTYYYEKSIFISNFSIFLLLYFARDNRSRE